MSSYYKEHKDEFIKSTIDCDMSFHYNLFEKYLSSSAETILDIGFGSGRDMKYFSSVGYEVEGIDSSICFVNNLKDAFNVYHKRVEDIDIINEYEGIWACASLLHVKRKDLLDVFRKCFLALKQNGVMYASFKYGDFEGIIDDRHFTYLTEETFTNIINQTNFKIDKLWINEDKLNRDVKWLNVVIKKEFNYG